MNQIMQNLMSLSLSFALSAFQRVLPSNYERTKEIHSSNNKMNALNRLGSEQINFDPKKSTLTQRETFKGSSSDVPWLSDCTISRIPRVALKLLQRYEMQILEIHAHTHSYFTRYVDELLL